MKRSKLPYLMHWRAVALVATGVFLGRGAQADTTLDFDVLPPGVNNNSVVAQTFGDEAGLSSEGITVTGFGTPNIGLTWQGTGGTWQHYTESGGGAVWTAVQLDNSDVGDRHELIFTPNHPSAAVVIKSFNLHGYYISTERFTYDVSILAGTTVVSGPTNITFLSDATKDHPVSLSYTGMVGQALTLRLDRVASALQAGEVEGDRGDIAVDDIVFAQLPETEFAIGPEVLSVFPANLATGIAPDYDYRAVITNRSTAIVTNSIQLRFNGTPLTPTITESDGLTTVSYAAAGLLPAGSSNRYTLTYADNSLPTPKNYTNEVSYVVAMYQNRQLPAPIVFQNFDATPEGEMPAGWTLSNRDTVRDPFSEPNINFANLDSDAYTNWAVVDVSRFTGTFDVYSMSYNGNPPPVGWTEDYRRVLAVSPSNVVNGVFLRDLATGRMVFGNSGYRSDHLGQILFLHSPDFNLSGQSNIHLAFHSLWEQNQDSIGAVEYSVDSGATWLPALYMLEVADVFTNLDGTIDSLKTFTNEVVGGFQGIAQWVEGGVTNGGYYGAFIGVASNLWGTLAPYISARAEENTVDSKRVEVIRLPLADNQTTVRLRFATAGSDSWYWGVDNIGLYSIASLRITSIVPSGGNVVITWPAEASTRLQQSTSLSLANWQDVAGTVGAGSVSLPATNAAAFFRLYKP